MLRVATIGLGLCIAAALGCSDDEGGGGSGGAGGGGGTGAGGEGTGGTGGGDIPPDTMLSALTEDQAIQLCEANRAAIQAVIDAACTIIGLGEADEAACVTRRDDCTAVLTADGGDLTVDCSDPNVIDYSSCDATVGDLSDCEDEIVSYSNDLDCSMAGAIPDAPACSEALRTQCPDVFPAP